MGVDFIKKCAKGFQKSWDRGQKELAAPNLFSRDPALAARTYCALPADGANFHQDRELILRISDNEARLYDGCSVVGTLKDNPPALVASVAEGGCGVAVARVVNVHAISGAADVVVA